MGTDLVDETGRSIHWYPLLGFGSWLDDAHFILCSTDETRPGYDFTTDHVWLADTSGADPKELQMPRRTECPTANGHGAVDGVRFLGTRNGIERDDYWLWSDGVSSDVRSGFPYNWSLDGSKLAVVHPFEPTRGTLGWREIVSWPGLDTVWKEDPPAGGAAVDFDPTGQFMALPGDETLADGTDRFFTTIVNLATGQEVEVPATDRGSYFWTSGYLNTIDDTELMSYDPSGKLITNRPAPGNVAQASADGSTVTYWTRDDYPQSTATVERNGALTTIDFPVPVYYSPSLSNDGRAIALDEEDGAIYLYWF